MEDKICEECGKKESDHVLSPEIEKILEDIDSGKIKMVRWDIDDYLKRRGILDSV